VSYHVMLFNRNNIELKVMTIMPTQLIIFKNFTQLSFVFSTRNLSSQYQEYLLALLFS